MAKRLTDTDKWKDEWYLSLGNDYRIVWQYILDNCNHSGILKKSFDLMNFCCKTNLSSKQFDEVFKERVYDCGNFYFIPGFIKFQYGENLNSSRPVIISVKKELTEKNLLRMIVKSLLNDCNTIKSKRTDKRTDKSKSKEAKPFSFTPPKKDVDKILGREQ